MTRRRTTCRVAALGAATLTAWAAPATWSASPQAASSVPAGTVALSNESTRTQWAYSISEAPIRSTPSVQGKTVGQLRLLTESGFAETYLVLSRFRDAQGIDWLRIRIPGRPNGRTGWVSRQALGTLRTTTTQIVVDRRRLKLTVRRAGKLVMSARIGVGKRATPTPAGRFYVRERYRNLGGGGVYGARALGLSAYAPYLTDWPRGGVVGIHGTNQPGLIPGRPSHGCIRLKNRDAIRLFKLANTGTPVYIT